MFARILFLLFALVASTAFAETPREVIARALTLSDTTEQAKLVSTLASSESPDVEALLNQWKASGIHLYKPNDDTTVPVLLDAEKDAEGAQLARSYTTNEPLKNPEGKPLRLVAADIETAETDSIVRVAMSGVLGLIKLSSPDFNQRLKAAENMVLEQNPDRIPVMQDRIAKEPSGRIQRILKQGVAMAQLKDESDEVKIAACKQLGSLGSIPSQDSLKQIAKDATEAEKPAVAAAATAALAEIASHLKVVNSVGTAFRGVSSGSILLVAAIGLAITFGLMGVINMAHGEMIAIGAYTTYIVQCVFGPGLEVSPFGFHVALPGMNATGWRYDAYFIVALPLSFLVAALAGVALERGIIRFLYRRPLESLLATWGVSLVLQQLFRLTFGASNVQVSSPSWLSGNWTVNDIGFGWNRLFVIGFAIAIVFGLSLLLKKTPLGLLIRAVMQNRGMAACMGVRTERVNMMTFALGSGLAGLAGAFVSQIGNVGPGLGQEYIVDSFMTVVVGGVGNLIGTVASALSIGVADQSLQQSLGNPVIGKILVLVGIILFLQWRPAGLFVTKSRSLEG
jgi:urea transport system permease protein